MHTFPGDAVEHTVDLRLGYPGGRLARAQIFRENVVHLPKWSVFGDAGTIVCPDFDLLVVQLPNGTGASTRGLHRCSRATRSTTAWPRIREGTPTTGRRASRRLTPSQCWKRHTHRRGAAATRFSSDELPVATTSAVPSASGGPAPRGTACPQPVHRAPAVVRAHPDLARHARQAGVRRPRPPVGSRRSGGGGPPGARREPGRRRLRATPGRSPYPAATRTGSRRAEASATDSAHGRTTAASQASSSRSPSRRRMLTGPPWVCVTCTTTWSDGSPHRARISAQ